MANTGRVIYQNLEEYNVATGQPTGETKPNNPSDPDYVAPVDDSEEPSISCPVAEPEPTNCVAIELTNGGQSDEIYSYTDCSGQFINDASLVGSENVSLCVQEIDGEPSVSYEGTSNIFMSSGGSCT